MKLAFDILTLSFFGMTYSFIEKFESMKLPLI